MRSASLICYVNVETDRRVVTVPSRSILIKHDRNLGELRRQWRDHACLQSSLMHAICEVGQADPQLTNSKALFAQASKQPKIEAELLDQRLRLKTIATLVAPGGAKRKQPEVGQHARKIVVL